MGDQRGQSQCPVPLSLSHCQQSLSNGPVSPLVVSHRGALPDNIKGSHSEKSFGQETIPHTSLGRRCLLSFLCLCYVLTLLLRSPSQCMFGSPWRPQLSSPPFSLVPVTLVVYFIASLCVTLCWHAAGSRRGSAPHTEDCARLWKGYSSLA